MRCPNHLLGFQQTHVHFLLRLAYINYALFICESMSILHRGQTIHVMCIAGVEIPNVSVLDETLGI